MTPRYHGLAVGLFLLGVAAVAHAQQTRGALLQQADPRELIADDLADKGELYKALIHYKILRTRRPQNPRYQKRIHELQNDIKKQVKRQFTIAQTKFELGDQTAAGKALLRILAIDPRNRRALVRLRRIQSRKLMDIQQAHLASLQDKVNQRREQKQVLADIHYYEAGVEAYKKGDIKESINKLEQFLYRNPGQDNALPYLHKAHLQMASRLYDQGQLQQALYHYNRSAKYTDHPNGKLTSRIQRVKSELAEHYYAQGLRYYLEDVHKAINFWEDSLSLNPGLSKVKARLQKAYQMRRNLERIGKP